MKNVIKKQKLLSFLIGNSGVDNLLERLHRRAELTGEVKNW